MMKKSLGIGMIVLCAVLFSNITSAEENPLPKLLDEQYPNIGKTAALIAQELGQYQTKPNMIISAEYIITDLQGKLLIEYRQLYLKDKKQIIINYSFRLSSKEVSFLPIELKNALTQKTSKHQYVKLKNHLYVLENYREASADDIAFDLAETLSDLPLHTPNTSLIDLSNSKF